MNHTSQTLRLLFLTVALHSNAVMAQVAAPADADADVEKLPPAPTHFMGREIAHTMHYLGAPWLVRESRDREEDCNQLIKALNIKAKQTVCDIGCGNGFYTLRLAQRVGPHGGVLAVDIQQEMLDMLVERTEARGLTNVKPVLGTFTDPKLPPASVDLILAVDVYHEFSHPQQMLAALRKSLRPNGRLALVEFRLEDPEVPIKLLHKMSLEQMEREFSSHGFKLVEQFDALPWQHVLFFARDDSPLKPVELHIWSAPAEGKTPQ